MKSKTFSYSLNSIFLTNRKFAFLILIMIWQILHWLIQKPALPSPILVVKNAFHETFNTLSIHLGWSLIRITVGVSLGGFFGLIFGFISGFNKNLNKVIEPYLFILNLIPKIALLPLFIIVLGIGELSKISIIFTVIFFQVLLSMRDAVKSIEADYIQSIKSINTQFLFLFKHLIFPRILPSFLTSIRISLTTAMAILFISETYATEYGLGYYVMDSLSQMNYVNAYTGILSLTVMGYFLFWIISAFEQRFCFWAHHFQS